LTQLLSATEPVGQADTPLQRSSNALGSEHRGQSSPAAFR
jgi:hypothetical protein